MVDNGYANGIVSYGVDINNFAGDLIQNESKVPTRLNPSFGAITYSDNTRYANYNGVFFDVRGHFSRGFVDASYTRSKSNDDARHIRTRSILRSSMGRPYRMLRTASRSASTMN